MKQENRRKKRMKIKAEAYRLVNTDLNVSESEAEPDDKELEDDKLATYRIQKLTRLYVRRGQKKATDQIKSNTIRQAMIGKVLFDGTVRGLNTFMIDLKSTSVSRSWRDLFVMPLPTTRRLPALSWQGLTSTTSTALNHLPSRK